MSPSSVIKRHVASRLPHSVERRLRSVRRWYQLRQDPVRERPRALEAELAFWDSWFDRPTPDLEKRLRGELDDAVVIRYLGQLGPAAEYSLLDVGSGPLTTLGTRLNGTRVQVTAVDALGDAYAALLARRGIVPPVRPMHSPARTSRAASRRVRSTWRARRTRSTTRSTPSRSSTTW